MKLTKNDAEEVAYKLGILAEELELQEDYGLTQVQADALLASVPHHGGDWTIPAFGLEAVRGEMADHCVILDGIASDARGGGEIGQSLAISKQAKRLRLIFQTANHD
jgi:hypothetical protein